MCIQYSHFTHVVLAHALGTGDDYLLEQVTHYGSQLPMYIVRITGKQKLAVIQG